MKKHLLFVSMIAALTITGCNINHADNDSTSKDPATTSETSQNSDGSEQSSNPIESSKEEIKNEFFTLLTPNNLSSMSPNCKKYVDDMKAQQKETSR